MITKEQLNLINVSQEQFLKDVHADFYFFKMKESNLVMWDSRILRISLLATVNVVGFFP